MASYGLYFICWAGQAYFSKLKSTFLSDFVFYDVIGNDVISLFLADEIEETQNQTENP